MSALEDLLQQQAKALRTLLSQGKIANGQIQRADFFQVQRELEERFAGLALEQKAMSIETDANVDELRRIVASLQQETDVMQQNIGSLRSRVGDLECRGRVSSPIAVPSSGGDLALRLDEGEAKLLDFAATVDELVSNHHFAMQRVSNWEASQQELAQAVSELDHSMHEKGEQLIASVEQRLEGAVPRSLQRAANEELSPEVEELREQVNVALGQLQDRMELLAEQCDPLSDESISRIRSLVAQSQLDAVEKVSSTYDSMKREVSQLRSNLQRVELQGEGSIARKQAEDIEVLRQQVSRFASLREEVEGLQRDLASKRSDGVITLGRERIDTTEGLERRFSHLQKTAASNWQSAEENLREELKARLDEVSQTIGHVQDELHLLNMGQEEAQNDVERLQAAVERHLTHAVMSAPDSRTAAALQALEAQRDRDSRRVKEAVDQCQSLRGDVKRCLDAVGRLCQT